MKDLAILIMRYMLIFVMIMAAILAVGLFIQLVDAVTTQKIGDRDVPCYDNEDNLIQELTCTEETFCTMWGFVHGNKCSEVLG